MVRRRGKCTLPPLICPLVQTADMDIVVTMVTMFARQIMIDPSAAIMTCHHSFTTLGKVIFDGLTDAGLSDDPREPQEEHHTPDV